MLKNNTLLPCPLWVPTWLKSVWATRRRHFPKLFLWMLYLGGVPPLETPQQGVFQHPARLLVEATCLQQVYQLYRLSDYRGGGTMRHWTWQCYRTWRGASLLPFARQQRKSTTRDEGLRRSALARMPFFSNSWYHIGYPFHLQRA